MSTIDDHYKLHGKMLGGPLHEERTCPDGVGRFRTCERGSIHHHPDTGTWESYLLSMNSSIHLKLERLV